MRAGRHGTGLSLVVRALPPMTHNANASRPTASTGARRARRRRWPLLEAAQRARASGVCNKVLGSALRFRHGETEPRALRRASRSTSYPRARARAHPPLRVLYIPAAWPSVPCFGCAFFLIPAGTRTASRARRPATVYWPAHYADADGADGGGGGPSSVSSSATILPSLPTIDRACAARPPFSGAVSETSGGRAGS